MKHKFWLLFAAVLAVAVASAAVAPVSAQTPNPTPTTTAPSLGSIEELLATWPSYPRVPLFPAPTAAFTPIESFYGPTSFEPPAGVREQFLEMVNNERAAVGSPPMVLDYGPGGQCESDQWLITGQFHPMGCTWDGAPTPAVGSTSGGVMDFGASTVGEAVDGFMRSLGHQAQLLAYDNDRMQIGVACIAARLSPGKSVLTFSVSLSGPELTITSPEVDKAWTTRNSVRRPGLVPVTDRTAGISCGHNPNTPANITGLATKANVLTNADARCLQAKTNLFKDVPEDVVFDVQCMYGLGITTGVNRTTYWPRGHVTREQMATFLARTWKAEGGVCEATDSGFVDVNPNSWSKASIDCLRSTGITHGTSQYTFSPGDEVTREQMAAFVARTFRGLNGGVCVGEDNPFNTLTPSDTFAYEDIRCLFAHRIAWVMQYTPATKRLPVTREEMAMYLGGLIHALAPSFDDLTRVANPWAFDPSLPK